MFTNEDYIFFLKNQFQTWILFIGHIFLKLYMSWKPIVDVFVADFFIHFLHRSSHSSLELNLNK